MWHFQDVWPSMKSLKVLALYADHHSLPRSGPNLTSSLHTKQTATALNSFHFCTSISPTTQRTHHAWSLLNTLKQRLITFSPFSTL